MKALKIKDHTPLGTPWARSAEEVFACNAVELHTNKHVSRMEGWVNYQVDEAVETAVLKRKRQRRIR